MTVNTRLHILGTAVRSLQLGAIGIGSLLLSVDASAVGPVMAGVGTSQSLFMDSCNEQGCALASIGQSIDPNGSGYSYVYIRQAIWGAYSGYRELYCTSFESPLRVTLKTSRENAYVSIAIVAEDTESDSCTTNAGVLYNTTTWERLDWNFPTNTAILVKSSNPQTITTQSTSNFVQDNQYNITSRFNCTGYYTSNGVDELSIGSDYIFRKPNSSYNGYVQSKCVTVNKQ